VFIRDVLPDGTTRTIRFEHWTLHDQMLADVELYDRIVALKARQLGISWWLAAYLVWGMLYNSGWLGGVVSAGELEATEFIDKCRFILAHLPYETPVTLDPDNMLSIGVHGSSIIGFPSTAKAGRGFSFNVWVAEEAAFHPFAEDAYASYEAATEHGKVLVVSSAGDPEKQIVSDFFQRLWEGSPANGYQARFYAWHLRPGRDAEWYEVRKARLSSRPGQMEREYPSNPQEGFRSMLSLRFSTEGMEYGKSKCVSARTQVHLPEGVTPDSLQVWSEPRPNIPYVIYTDSADGVGKDYTVTTVAESRTLTVVCRFRENRLEPEAHGAKARRLAIWYNTALASWERNRGEGIALAYAGYSRIHLHDARTPRQKADDTGAKPRPGIPVTDATRDDLISGLAEVIDKGALYDPDVVFWNEAERFIMADRVTASGHHYRAQAAPNAHDDIVACNWGIVQLAKQSGATSMRGVVSQPRQAKWGFS